jgi:branched-chain amino acid transport system substrate-binding protein
MRGTRFTYLVTVAAVVLVAGACGSSAKHQASASSSSSTSAKGPATEKAITLGYIGDFTGVSSSTFSDGYGGAEARIDAQNALGGVDGHQLKLIRVDTGSTPSQAATAVQELVSDHVFGIIEDSAFFFAGAKYAQQAGVPVTGYGIDGPEWFTQPYTNMFDVFDAPEGPVQGKAYTWTTAANFMKLEGVTKFGILGYGISPSSTLGVKTEIYTMRQAGIGICYDNLSVPFGGVDFTADVLQIKQAGCNGLATSFEDASDIAMAQDIKNAGISMKSQLYSEGYDNDVLHSAPARAAIDGDSFATSINFTSPNAATKQLLATLSKYDPGFAGGGIPDLGLYSGYLSADLMIYGLQRAGANPTQASFISNLRQIDDYTADGILASPTTFEHFGTAQMLPVNSCEWFVQLQGSHFITQNGGKTVCGKLESVPGV